MKDKNLIAFVPTFTKEELENEKWIHFHTVTYPQKYYERGTKMYVSNLGRIMIDNVVVNIYPRKGGKIYFLNKQLARIVYNAFIGEVPKGYNITHIDSNIQNNKLDNLRACTRSEQMRNTIVYEKLKMAMQSKDYKKAQREQNKGRINMHKEDMNTKIWPEQYDEYIKAGWSRGYCKKVK